MENSKWNMYRGKIPFGDLGRFFMILTFLMQSTRQPHKYSLLQCIMVTHTERSHASREAQIIYLNNLLFNAFLGNQKTVPCRVENFLALTYFVVVFLSSCLCSREKVVLFLSPSFNSLGTLVPGDNWHWLGAAAESASLCRYLLPDYG